MRSNIDGIAILDENKKFKYLDQSFAELYGYQNPPQLIGKSWDNTYASLHLRRFKEEMLPILEEEKKWSGVMFGLKKNGTRFSQEISVFELGREGLVFLVKNIGPKGRSVFEIGQPQYNWPEAVNSPPDIVTIISLNYEILEINPTGAEKLGKAAEKVKGAKCYNVVHKLPSPINGCPCKTTVETGEPGVGVVSEDGTNYVVTAFPLLDRSGELKAFLHTVTEISNQAPGKIKACEFFIRELAQLKGTEETYLFLLHSISEVLGPAKVTLHEKRSNRLKCIIQNGYRRPMKGEELDLASGGVRVEAFKQRKSIYLPKVAGNDEFIRFDPEVKCEFVTPISTGKNTLGILDVRRLEPNSVTPSERNIIEIMATEAAKSIEGRSTLSP